jgi:energy-coupling factor transporter transmembrane protein EcfT
VTERPAPRPRPLQYRSGRSPLHRLGAGHKLLAASALGALALAADGLPALAGLAALVASGYAAARLPAADLWRDLRWLLVQGAAIVLLTVWLRGSESLASGCRTALQLVLVFLPAALVLRTTTTESLLGPLRGRLPERLCFAAAATLRFLPVFARELGELIEMQRLRGARLVARDLWRPGAWRDWLSCIAFPMAVRAIEVSERAAEAAEIRGIGAADGPARAEETA